MEAREFEGRTAAEAAIKACEVFNVSRAQLRYEVLSDEGEGLDRRVVIRAEVDELPAQVQQSIDGGYGEHERHSRGRRDGRGERDGRDGRGRRGRGDRRGGRGGRRGGRSDHRHRPHPKTPRDEGDGFESLLNLEVMPKELPPERPELDGEPSAKAVKAQEVLGEVLRLMGVAVTAHRVQDDAEEIHFDLRGDDAAKVIGKKGDVLLSLQFIVNRIVSRSAEEAETQSEGAGQVVVLDAAGYRGRRRDALAELAKRLAERAVAEKKVVRLSPMSAHDRRVFHLTLRDVDGVDTRSEGEGLYRNLLIIPSEFVG